MKPCSGVSFSASKWFYEDNLAEPVWAGPASCRLQPVQCLQRKQWLLRSLAAAVLSRPQSAVDHRGGRTWVACAAGAQALLRVSLESYSEHH